MSNTGTTYVHDQWKYYVRQREDNGKFTVYLSDGKDLEETVATIPDFPTFEEAQNALDGYALKHKFAAECSTPGKEPEMDQQTFGDVPTESSDPVPPADDIPEVEQQNDATESGNDGDDSENDSPNPDNANPPSDNDSDDSENGSGDSENDKEEPDDTEEKDDPLPDGPTLSLRLPAFDSVFDDADETLRRMAVTLKTKLIESGELVIKVTLNNYNGVLKPDPKKCNVACNLKPAKVSTPIRFPSDLEIMVEKDGRVIIPEDREHQINFDEIQPGQHEYPPEGGTVTVDGQTGLAEHYEGNEEDKPDDDESAPETPEESPQNMPDSDFEGDPNAQEDQPPYSDGEELGQGDDEE